MPVPSIEWNDDQIAELTRLWDAGMSITSIGIEMGVSRNAVVGKARRLKLSPRDRVIASLSPALRAKVATMLSAGVSAAKTATACGVNRQTAQRIARRLYQDAAAERSRIAALPSNDDDIEIDDTPLPPRRLDSAIGPGPGVGMAEIARSQCQWPLWGRERPTFRCCGAPATPGRPYCAEHAARAYRTVETGTGRVAA